VWSCRLALLTCGCVARHTPCHGFLPGLAHVTLCSSVRRPGGTWLRELRPPQVTEPNAAIGRPLSRMPVIIRSHESSPASMREDVRRGMEFVLQFVQVIDIERNYFSKALIPARIIDSPSPVSLRETVLSPKGEGGAKDFWLGCYGKSSGKAARPVAPCLPLICNF
jgi:hypothetical protein